MTYKYTVVWPPNDNDPYIKVSSASYGPAVSAHAKARLSNAGWRIFEDGFSQCSAIALPPFFLAEKVIQMIISEDDLLNIFIDLLI